MILSKNDDWRVKNYNHKRKNSYRDDLIAKEKILIQNNAIYLFIFSSDMVSGNYKQMTLDLLNKLNIDWK